MKKSRFLAIVLSCALLLMLLPTSALALPATELKELWLQGYDFGEDHTYDLPDDGDTLYLYIPRAGQSFASGASLENWNASITNNGGKFTLTLKDIILCGALGHFAGDVLLASGNLTIKLIGDNLIRGMGPFSCIGLTGGNVDIVGDGTLALQSAEIGIRFQPGEGASETLNINAAISISNMGEPGNVFDGERGCGIRQGAGSTVNVNAKLSVKTVNAGIFLKEDNCKLNINAPVELSDCQVGIYQPDSASDCEININSDLKINVAGHRSDETSTNRESYGIYAEKLSVSGGTSSIVSDNDTGIDTFEINVSGGSLDVSGEEGGIFTDKLNVSGGSLDVESESESAGLNTGKLLMSGGKLSANSTDAAGIVVSNMYSVEPDTVEFKLTGGELKASGDLGAIIFAIPGADSPAPAITIGDKAKLLAGDSELVKIDLSAITQGGGRINFAAYTFAEDPSKPVTLLLDANNNPTALSNASKTQHWLFEEQAGEQEENPKTSGQAAAVFAALCTLSCAGAYIASRKQRA